MLEIIFSLHNSKVKDNNAIQCNINDVAHELRVWVLGSENPNADKCIQWDALFPSFADADVLIVNLQSLNKEILERNTSKMKNAAQEIFEKSINGGELFFITAP